MPVGRHLQVGDAHVRPQDEWIGEKFALFFGNRIPFVHIPILMKRDGEGVLVGKYVCET